MRLKSSQFYTWSGISESMDTVVYQRCYIILKKSATSLEYNDAYRERISISSFIGCGSQGFKAIKWYAS